MAENLPVYEPTKMARRREALATLGMLSGDPVLAQVGKVMARDSRSHPIMNLGRGVIYDPNTGRSSIAPEYQAQLNDDRQHDRDLLNERLTSARLTAKRLSGGAGDGTDLLANNPGERKQLAQYERELSIGNAILESMRSTPGSIHRGVDIASDVVGNLYGPMRNLTEGIFYSDDQQKVRNTIHRWIAGIRKSELGSAVSGYELQKEQEWSPIAKAITQEEAVRRMETFLHDHNVALEAMRNQMGWSSANTFGQGRDVGLPAESFGQGREVEPTGYPAEEPARYPDEVRTVGGKQVYRYGEHWYEAD